MDITNIFFKQSRNIKDYAPLINDNLLPVFGYVFLYSVLQWCKIVKDDYEGTGKHWDFHLICDLKNNSAIGVCGLYSLVSDNNDELWLSWFGFIPDYRNKGLGKEAIQFLYDKAIAQNCKKIMCYVDKDGRALNFYKREGFKVIGTVKEYLFNNNMDKIDGADFEAEDDIVIMKEL